MPSISTRVHGLLDYLLGGLLVAVPWLLSFPAGGPQRWVPVGVGAVLLLYSAFTDYEYGMVRRIQMPVHLWGDGLGGVLLAASPWLWGFDHQVWIPYVAVGAFQVLISIISNTIPTYERRRAR